MAQKHPGLKGRNFSIHSLSVPRLKPRVAHGVAQLLRHTVPVHQLVEKSPISPPELFPGHIQKHLQLTAMLTPIVLWQSNLNILSQWQEMLKMKKCLSPQENMLAAMELVERQLVHLQPSVTDSAVTTVLEE